MDELIEKIQQWVIDRNLHTQDPRLQMCKTVEELGELAKAINKNDIKQQEDGIGDSIITIMCISMQLKLDFKKCLEIAYNEIKDRKGKLVNGTFVKEQDLKK
jgi:NTP pyrophosphatase (non-canonical NTP hydrolase)